MSSIIESIPIQTGWISSIPTARSTSPGIERIFPNLSKCNSNDVCSSTCCFSLSLFQKNVFDNNNKGLRVLHCAVGEWWRSSIRTSNATTSILFLWTIVEFWYRKRDKLFRVCSYAVHSEATQQSVYVKDNNGKVRTKEKNTKFVLSFRIENVIFLFFSSGFRRHLLARVKNKNRNLNYFSSLFHFLQ